MTSVAATSNSRLLGIAMPFRWLLLLSFVPGLIGTRIDQYGSIVALSIAALAACALLLTRLKRPAGNSLWAWLILVVFLNAYFMVTWIVSSDLDSRIFILTNYPELYWITPQVVAEGYAWSVLGFVVFCVTAWALLGSRRGGLKEARRALGDRSESSHFVVPIAVFAFGAALVAEIFRWRLGVGVAGLINPELPFRSVALLNRIAIDIAPGLTLLVIWVSDRRPGNRLTAWFLLSLLMQAVMYTVTSTSRGGLIRFMLPLAFMWVLCRRFTGRRVLMVIGVLVATVATFSFLSLLRGISMGQNSGISTESLRRAASGPDQRIGLTQAATLLATRMTGAGSVWQATRGIAPSLSAKRLYHFTFEEPVQTYLTFTLVEVADAGDFRAPGLVGMFMILGGTAGVVILMAAYVAFIKMCWSLLTRLKTAPVGLAIFAEVAFVYSSEGGIVFQNFVAAFAVAAMCELMYRRVIAPIPSRRRFGQPAFQPSSVDV